MNRTTHHPFHSLQNDINRMFEDMFGEVKSARDWQPSVDISETPEAFIVRAELPGVTANDVKLNMSNNVLTLYGEKKQEAEDNSKNYYRIERSYGSFERSFSFPREVQEDNISATYKDGVLTVTIPKAEKAKPKEIPIRTA
jgi:HSP20 family protein